MSFFIYQPLFFGTLSFLIGLILGSFLNVVVFRLPRKQSIIFPPSRCTFCQTKLTFWQLIPILSFFLLKGKCFTCKKRISIRYPIIEFLTGLLFLATSLQSINPWSLILRDWPFISFLLAIAFIDLEHQIIPDQLSLSGLCVGLLTCSMKSELGILGALSGAGLGFGIFYFLAWVYFVLRGKMGLGGGDIKLLAMIGAFIGPYGVLITILISSILGSLVGIGLLYIQREKNFSEFILPYGPFLVAGALGYYLFEGTVWLYYLTQV